MRIEKNIARNLLFISTAVHTIGDEILTGINELLSHNIDWLKCVVGVAARTMCGKNIRLLARTNEVIPSVVR